MNAILTIAGRGFRDGLRNRWVLAIALVLAILAVGIAGFGEQEAGTLLLLVSVELGGANGESMGDMPGHD